MNGLINEIQADAMDKNTSVTDLLRKALAASSKLNIDDMVQWIEQELGGYKSRNDVPEYRKLRGSLKARNPYHGWVPFNIPGELGDQVEQLWLTESIAELEAGLASNPKGPVQYSMSASHQSILVGMMEFPMEPALFTSRGALFGIIDAVRNHILRWALALEKEGVKGEGLSFSQKEVQVASHVNYVTNIGSMNHSQVQQHSSGAQTYNMGDPAPFLDLMAELIARVSELPADMQDEVRSDAQTVIAQVNSPKPKTGIVSEAVKSIRSILENAAGNALSSDMLPRLVKAASACGFG